MKGGQERRGGIIITQPSSEKEAKMLKKKRNLFSSFFILSAIIRESSERFHFRRSTRRGYSKKKKKGKRPRYSINPSPSDYLSNPRRNRGSQPTSQLASGSLNFTGVLLNGQLEAREGMNKFPSITTR